MVGCRTSAACSSKVSLRVCIVPILFLIFFIAGLLHLDAGPAFAAHKLVQQECYDCHAVGGRKSVVIQGTRLIKADARMTEIQGGGWISGTLPCVYCHQDISHTRSNMVGVKDHFSPVSISKHPVDYLISNAGSSLGGTYIGGNLNIQCVDCHSSVQYVNNAPNPGSTINPNIHGVDTSSVSATDVSGGNLLVSATFYGGYSPYNADTNAACTKRCHDPAGTDVATGKQYHGYGSTLITLETASAPFTTIPGGCLSLDGSATGCHGIHNSQGNTDNITLNKPTGGYVTRTDCGICHNFDDPDGTGDRSGSEYMMYGHGKGTVNITCTQCHDSNKNHFDPAADPQDSRLLSYVAGSSSFSSPPKALNANCGLCHSSYQPHSTTQVNVGCLDCHDPHGRGVAPNIRMIRSRPPVASSTALIAYTTQGLYWDSSSYALAPTFTNTVCDNRDCHIGPNGPGPINAIMNSTTGTHPGGTGPTVFDCQSCHTHLDGGGSMRAKNSCSTCHGDSIAKTNWPNSPSILVGAWPDRNGSHQVHMDAIIAGNPGISAGNATCDYCHPQGKHTDDGVAGDQNVYPATIHKDGVGSDTTTFKTMTGGSDTDAAYSIAGQTCSNIDCHGNQTSPNWYTGPGPIACGQCHTIPPLTGSHNAHADSDGDFTECYQCHTNNAGGGGYAATPSGTHNDGQVTFPVTITYDDKATPAVTDDTCLTSICHSPGTAAPANFATWGSPTSVSCSECHYGDTVSPTSSGNGNSGRPITGSHDAHFAASGMTIVCSDCHIVPVSTSHSSATAGSDGPVLADRAIAVQDEASVTSTALGGSGNDPDLANTHDPTCDNTVCHNPSDDGHISAPWGTTNAGCEMCHNTSTAPATVPAGSHSMHVTTRGYACTDCHVDNNSPTPNPGHLNQVIDFPNLTYNGTANDYPGSYGTCGTGSCHPGSIVWGDAPTNCDQCHYNSSDVNNFNGQDKTASVIGITEWNSVGHGASPGPALGCLDCHSLTSAGHDFSATLGSSSNPYRFDTSTGAFTCSDTAVGCHQAGITGPATGLDISAIVTHSTGEMAAAGYSTKYTWSFAPECVNCHDPHGDGSNLSMIQSQLYDKEAFSVTAAAPAAAIDNTSLVFTDNTTGLSSTQEGYADYTVYSSVCQECHEGTPGTDTPYVFVDNARANTIGHPGYVSAASDNPGDCSTCHKHDSAFKPSGCSGCHGSAATGQYWPDGSGGLPAYVDDEKGSHDSHVLAIGQYLGYGDYNTTMYNGSQQTTICAFCHLNPGGSGHTTNTTGSPAARVDVLGDGFTPPGTFTVLGVGAQAIKADTNNAAAYSQASATCSNVDCHYEKTTPAYAGSGWGGGDAVGNDPDCETCHYYRDGGSYPTSAWQAGDLPDAHQVHVAGIQPPSNSQSHDYPCSYCHDVTGYTTAHTNGEIDLSDAGSPNQGVDGNTNDETITPSSVTVKYGLGSADTSCANFYCHGADFSTPTQGTNVSPIWNSQSTAYCSACHDVDTRSTSTLGQEFTQGRHRTHLSPGAPFIYGPPYTQHALFCTVCHGVENNTSGSFMGGCGADACHPGGGFGAFGSAADVGFASFPSRDHVEGSFQVDFEGDLSRGWNDITDYNSTPGILSTLGNAYNNGTDICNRCHSTATVGGVVGATLAKANWNSASYRIPCENCHNDITASYSTPVTGGITAPGVGGDDSTYGAMITGHNRTGSVYPGSGNSPAGKACTTCHDNMKPHIDGVDGTSFSATDVRYADTINGVSMGSATFAEDMCFACHQNTGADAGKQVSGHGNMNAVFTAGSTHDAQAESFAYRCDACHEPHGLTVNSLSNPNIYMVKGSVEVKNFSVPGTGADETTVVPVVYEAKTGTNSLDDGATQNNNMCVVCHTSASRPGSGTALTNPAGDGTHTSLNDYSVNEQGNDCSSCHQHDYDVDPSGTVDGFMPLSCDGCHTYPPTSGMHNRHVGSYGFNCSVCHQNAGSHNESSVIDSVQYQALAPTVLANNIDVVFDGAATAGTYSPAKGSRTALGAGTCAGVYCHGDAWPISAGGSDVTPEWNSASTGACGACHSTTDPGTNSHPAHLAAAGTFGVAIGCSTCHTAGTPSSGTHVNGEVTFTGAAAGYTGTTTDRDNSAALGTCGTNACHNDGTAAVGQPARSYTWGTALIDDCASCHQGAGMASNKHGQHLASNALPGTALTFNTTDECVTCHSGTTTGGGVASGASHINAVRDVSFAASFGYEGGLAGRANTGAATTCSTVRCHNGVGTPSWSAVSTITCGNCHHDAVLSSSPRPTWEGSVGRSHAAHANTDGVYTDCANCHTAFAANYTATGGTNHQNLAVDINPGGGAGAYAESLGGAGVDWSSGSDGIDNGTCASVWCHGSSAPVWGTSVACGSCHTDGQLPPTTGSHTAHLSAIAGSATQSGANTDYSECIACHNDNGDGYASGAGNHVNDVVDVLGTNVVFNTTTKTCNTSVCHSPSGGTLPTSSVWGSPATLNCNECHYWEAVPTVLNNSGSAVRVSTLSHNGHFGASGRAFVCTDCHQDNSGDTTAPRSHITSGSGTDGQVLTSRSNAVQDNALIDTAGSWFGPGTWDDAADKCTNMCHDPSGAAYSGSGVWGSTNAACTMCHADASGSPGTGSHDAHVLFGVTNYGRNFGCNDCHPDNGTVYGHMTGAVALSLANLTYTGSTAAPYGTPFGSCSTTDCHQDGTGIPIQSSTWGSLVSGCSCHSVSPTTGSHTTHIGATVYGPHPGGSVDCGECHAANSNNSTMNGYPTHLDGSVTFSDLNSVSSGGIGADSAVTVCSTCHGGLTSANAEAKVNWASSTRVSCESCHGEYVPAQISGVTAPAVVGSPAGGYGAGITGHNRTGSVYPGSGNSPAGKVCTTCHDNMKPHIDGMDGTSFSATDVRYADTINGVSMASATVVEDMCFACHQNTGADAGKQVSGHGNMNAAFTAGSTHDAQAESFAYRCDACHEPHGLTVNSLSNPNIYMVKGSVEVKNYSVPGTGADETTVVSVVYEARTGTNSLDDGATPGNNMCVVCHTDANRPGSGTALTNPAGDGTHAGLDDYSNNEQGSDCSACHQHDLDADVSTADGFMPLACDGCHTYPPTSGMHDRHVGSYGFNCSVCHQNAGSHNESAVIDSTQYQALAPTVLANNIDVVFDGAATAGTYSPAKGSRTALGAGTCTGVYCHGDGWTISAGGTDVTPEWNSASTGACGACHSATDPGTNSHPAHLAAAGTFGVTVVCSTCHTAGTVASGTHVDGNVTFTGAASGYTGSTGDKDNSVALGTCGTNACHNDGTVAVGPPVRLSYTWGTALTADCASCHLGNGMSTNKHMQHLAGNALPGTALTFNTTDECVTCHSGTTTGGGVASGASHINAVRDVSFAASFGYEGGLAGRANTGVATTCSTVRCHNGVGTPSWSAVSTITCGNCHHDAVLSSSPRPTWEGSVGRSHAAHANTDGVYTDCANCHTAFAANYTATGGTNHQNLVVDISPSGGSYSDTDGKAGVNYAAADYLDNGTCSATSCHGTPAPLPQWGVPSTVACGSCHSNGMPPVSGAHAAHFADSDTDYSECIACHGDNGDGYASGTGTHVNNVVDVAGTGVSWNNSGTAGTPADDTCTTTVCHSASPNAATWGSPGSVQCNECHYYNAAPSSAGNNADANPLTGSHNSHFASTVVTQVVCTDCHADNTGDTLAPRTHITSGTGTDGVVLTGRANAVQNEAAVTATALGIGGTDPDPGNPNCDNVTCHNPSNDAHAATWTVSTAACTLCHSSTDPGTGSHTAHVGPSVAGTYGITVGCTDCHVDNSGKFAHRNGVVNFSITGYGGDTGVGAPYGSCTTTTCHNDGTGTANSSPVWGTTVSQPACGICHAASPTTNAHGRHLAYPGVSGDCTVCHTSQTTVNHINNTVSLISTLASSYTGSLNVGDGGKYGSCAAGACHDTDSSDPAWSTSNITDCAVCHGDTAAGDTNSYSGTDRLASEISTGTQWSIYGHGSKGKVCTDCHNASSVSHDFTGALNGSTNPFRLDTSGGAFTCNNTSAGCHGALPAVVTHSAAAMSNAGYTPKYPWGFAPECLNCHDPHGDDANLKMIQRELYDKAAFNTSGAYPGNPTEQLGLAFTDTTTGLTSTQVGYADYGGGYSSVCQECHEGTPGTTTTYAFVDNTRANFSGHPGYVSAETDNPGDCSTCHKHDSAFKPSGCSGCHGNAGSDTYWPDGTTYPDRAGEHAAHISALQSEAGFSTSDAGQKAMCAYCHNDASGVGGSSHADYVSPADVGAFNRIWDGTADADGAYTPGDGTNGTCANVDCHNNRSTSPNYDWYDGATAACAMCHVDVTTSDATHLAHTGASGTYGATIICNTCHVNGVVWGTTPPPTGHRNGSWTLSFGYPYGTWTGVSYAGSWTAGTRGGCGTNPCHNDGTGTGAPVRSTYAWGTSMTDDCASCHAGSGMATNKHTQHLASNALPGTALTFNTTDECITCHSGTATGGGIASAGLHLNAARDVGFAASFSYEGGAAGRANTGASTTCSTIRCHNGVTTPSWSASTIVCGDCHHDSVVASSPRPTWEGSVGRSHAVHAGTASDGTGCTNCHTNAGGYTATGGTNHQDLVVDISPSGGTYSDTDGKAGVNYTATDYLDDGTCSGTSCHGAGTPVWGATGTVLCGDCHGDSTHTYGDDRDGALPVDLNGSAVSYTVGKHQKHISISKTRTGNYCNMCHNGAGSGTALHGDQTVQISFSTAGASATYTDGSPGSCSNLNGVTCHGTANWDPAATIPCNSCHGFGGADPSHVTDSGGISESPNCLHCHPSGHPSGTIAGSILVANNSTVGINYGGGGIHILANIGSRGAKTSEAEICWTCHDAQGTKVSEWGANQNLNTGNISYNYGSLNQTNWVGATWTSGTSNFGYKIGTIKSTHSANPAGTALITGTAYSTGGMTEALDAVGDIRCSYCHDVHGRHLVWGGDTPALDGSPYLRGTWKGNPYKEDGAPQSGMNGWAVQGPADGSYGLVPRASASTTNNGGVGGYWIDQNSGNPNSGETFGSTAGLCSLCHGTNVDSMDKTAGESLWVGTNGHSNAVIGGTGASKANIFTRTKRGQSALTVDPGKPSTQVDMGLYSETKRGYSYRGTRGYSYNPLTDGENSGTSDGYRAYAFQQFTWGNSAGGSAANISAGTALLVPDDGTDANAQTQYHTFNCGKCHNPHASRLPKLMITNCLDTNHNTWQDSYQTDNSGGASNGEHPSNWFSAQNCHRRGPTDATGANGSGTAFGPGWNKVTPW